MFLISFVNSLYKRWCLSLTVTTLFGEIWHDDVRASLCSLAFCIFRCGYWTTTNPWNCFATGTSQTSRMAKDSILGSLGDKSTHLQESKQEPKVQIITGVHVSRTDHITRTKRVVSLMKSSCVMTLIRACTVTSFVRSPNHPRWWKCIPHLQVSLTHMFSTDFLSIRVIHTITHAIKQWNHKIMAVCLTSIRLSCSVWKADSNREDCSPCIQITTLMKHSGT